jgi:hypothetical protein
MMDGTITQCCEGTSYGGHSLAQVHVVVALVSREGDLSPIKDSFPPQCLPACHSYHTESYLGRVDTLKADTSANCRLSWVVQIQIPAATGWAQTSLVS